MNDIVNSFVNKVHAHVLGGGSLRNATVVTHLVPVLDSSAPIDTKSKALCAIYHASEHNRDTLRGVDGVAKVVSFMAETNPEHVDQFTIDNACRLVCPREDGQLHLAVRMRVPASGASVISGLLEWYTLCSRSDVYVDFMKFLTTHRDTLRQLRKHNPVDLLSAHVAAHERQLYEDPSLMLKTWTLAADLVRGSRSLLLRLWQGCGPTLLESSAKNRVAERSGSIVPSFLRLVQSLPMDVDIPIPFDSIVCTAVSLDLFPGGGGRMNMALEILGNKSIAEQCLRHGPFAKAFFEHTVEHFASFTADAKRCALDHVTVAVSHTMHAPYHLFFDLYLNVSDDGTHGQRAAIFASLEFPHVAPHLARLVADLDTTRSKELDAALCLHLDQLIEQPCSSFGCDLTLRGTVPHVLFHIIECTIGNTLPTGPDVRFTLRVREYLQETAKTLRMDPSAGIESYCRNISELYGFSFDPTPSPLFADHELQACMTCCPVTLGWMHCPVVASDGCTYELSTILKLFRDSTLPTSPLTRAPLDSFVVTNRNLTEMERHLWALAQSRL